MVDKCHVLTNNMGTYASCRYGKVHHYHGVGSQHGMTLAGVGICEHKHKTIRMAYACTEAGK